MRAAGQRGGRGRWGPAGLQPGWASPGTPPRVPPRCGPGRGARVAPTWAFCRALRRSSCTKGFLPGGASRRASPAPALEAGASRGLRPRILMAAPPSARGAGEPSGPGASGTQTGAERRAGAGRGCAAPGAGQYTAAQAQEGRWRDVGGGRRRGRVWGGTSPQTPPTSVPARRPDPAPPSFWRLCGAAGRRCAGRGSLAGPPGSLGRLVPRDEEDGPAPGATRHDTSRLPPLSAGLGARLWFLN